MPHATQSVHTVGIVKQKGFTLIEISIVLTIIGLIVGGIFIGQSLIRNAELQSVISDVKRYENAIQLFKEKYKYLPGDMPNATSFWGADSSCPNTAANTTPKTATCNGDGNGSIGGLNCASGSCVSSNAYEIFRAWQQLADAGFIDGSYTGVVGPASTHVAMPGVNVPSSAITGGGYFISLVNDPNGVANYPITFNHVIYLGASTASGGSWAPLLTAQEAYGIDLKTDDGLPGTGNVLGPTQTPNCTTTNVASTAAYNTSVGGTTCMLEFLSGYTGGFTNTGSSSSSSSSSGGSCGGGMRADGCGWLPFGPSGNR